MRRPTAGLIQLLLLSATTPADAAALAPAEHWMLTVSPGILILLIFVIVAARVRRWVKPADPVRPPLKGRPPTIRELITVVLSGIALAVLLIALLSGHQRRIVAEIREAQAQHAATEALVDTLLRDSHDLTRMARLNLVTGDPRYRVWFEQIIAISTGEAPRPQHYDAGYWDRVIAAGTRLLDLITYFTANEKEAHAWTLPSGATALDAAGQIHTDFARGFICAETISYDDFVGLGGEQAAKDAGKMRQEGRDYKIRDGDVLLFRFNV